MQMRSLLLFVSSLLLIAGNAVAQSTPLHEQPFMRMLARVPTSVPIIDLAFSDQLAITAAYPEAQLPSNWDDLDAVMQGEFTEATRPLAIWWRVFRNFRSSGIPNLLFFSEGERTTQDFDILRLHQELNYGLSSTWTLALTGNFDTNAIRDWWATRGYNMVEDGGEAALWCAEGDCNSGTQANIDQRDPGNPFGGEVGRTWPMLLGPDFMIGSEDEATMQAHLGIFTRGEPTLADDARIRAAVRVAVEESILLQAYIFKNELYDQFADPVFLVPGPRPTPEALRAFYQSLLEDYIDLPHFDLLVVADTVSGSQQHGKVVLVYSNESDAWAAADVLPTRLENYRSAKVDRSLVDLLADRNLTLPNVTLEPAEGLYTVVVDFIAPLPDLDILLTYNMDQERPAGYVAPGDAFFLLMENIFGRDAGWLSTVPRTTLETLASG